jgi:NAD(P)-dependent dehydrogenase (short-subunit alcohol dehydrogenase family)
VKNLDGKVAFVTGGASGIGFGMVQNFLKEGMKVAVADWNEAHLEAARRTLAGSNAVHFLKVDVGDRDALRAAADEALRTFGRIHVLCNNAGVGGGGTADSPDFDDWDKAMRVNLGGVVNGTKIIVPHIRAHGEGGHVVNTASMAGVVPLPGMGAYATAKYAVRGFTDSLRMSLAPEGIGVSCLFPGATRSALVNLPEPESEEAAAAEPEFLRTLRAAFRVAMEPVDLGAEVVRAIRENRPYIFTHREFLDEVQAIHRGIEDAFPKQQDVPEARKIFEDTRRRQAEDLHALPMKEG